MCLRMRMHVSVFLRNPVCQEMGRKFKMSVSSSDKDTGLSYLHDLVLSQNCKRCKRFQSNVRWRIRFTSHAELLTEFIPPIKSFQLPKGF
jgi:sulfite reductase (ferredoxin)